MAGSRSASNVLAYTTAFLNLSSLSAGIPARFKASLASSTVDAPRRAACAAFANSVSLAFHLFAAATEETPQMRGPVVAESVKKALEEINAFAQELGVKEDAPAPSDTKTDSTPN